jgi:dTDP-4-dehydrorhamnose reductase
MIDHIILFGSTGMLGRYVYSYFQHHPRIHLSVVKEYRVHEDTFGEIDGILAKLGAGPTTCVVNCIGIIPQRKTSQDAKEYYVVNSLFPHRLWAACKYLGARMVQPTTDCIYDGIKGGYIETDPADEKGAYGIAKSLGEPLDGCTVLRTSIIGNEIVNKKSFMEWVLSNKDGQINGFSNHIWNGITCLQWCKVLEKMIQTNTFWDGIRHILSPDVNSKYDIARMISDVYGANILVNPVSTPAVVDKTLRTLYSTSSDFHIPPLRVQIEELKEFVLVE